MPPVLDCHVYTVGIGFCDLDNVGKQIKRQSSKWHSFRLLLATYVTPTEGKHLCLSLVPWPVIMMLLSLKVPPKIQQGSHRQSSIDPNQVESDTVGAEGKKRVLSWGRRRDEKALLGKNRHQMRQKIGQESLSDCNGPPPS